MTSKTLIILCCLAILVTTTFASSIISTATSYVEIIEPSALSGLRLPTNLATFSIAPPDAIGLEANLSYAAHVTACESSEFANRDNSQYSGTIVIVERGNCQFVDKVHNIETYTNAVGVLISNVADSLLITPIAITTGDKPTPDRYIPLVVGSLYGKDGNMLKNLLASGVPIRVRVFAEEIPRAM